MYYTGITNNLIRRWQEHNAAPKYSMQFSKPLEVVYVQPMPNRITARMLEVHIKQRGAARYLADASKRFQPFTEITPLDFCSRVTYI